jgi:predicted dehydrogenase
MIDRELYLVGTGPMAEEYVKVLHSMEIRPIVIGRGQESADRFESKTGIKPITGGFQSYVSTGTVKEDSYFIIATGTEVLMENLLITLSCNPFRVLVEKPGAISIEELLANEQTLLPYLDKVFVAYNRRFYSSVIEAQKIIEEDGGLTSMHFEFTEWAHRIGPLQKRPGVKENWFFANSTHVVDLAFYLAGEPEKWASYTKKGDLDWHDTSIFVGSGITKNGVLFSYHSNWESAGRWGIELMTNRRKLILKPLEEIKEQMLGTLNENPVKIDSDKDFIYKPGLFLLMGQFLLNQKCESIPLPNIKAQIKFARDIKNFQMKA